MQPDMNWFAVLAHHAARTPDKPMTVFEGQRHHLRGDGRDGPSRLAGGLAAQGVGGGDVVGLLSYNCPEFLETIFAANYLGAVAMPINWRLAAPEVRYILEHSGARALVCDGSLIELADEATAEIEATLVRVSLSSPPAAGWTALADLRATPNDGSPASGGGRRRAPADVHVGHHRTAQGRHAHPRQPGVEEPGPHRRVRIHRLGPRAGLRTALPRRRSRSHDDLTHRRRGHRSSSTGRSTRPRWSTRSNGRR